MDGATVGVGSLLLEKAVVEVPVLAVDRVIECYRHHLWGLGIIRASSKVRRVKYSKGAPHPGGGAQGKDS